MFKKNVVCHNMVLKKLNKSFSLIRKFKPDTVIN